MDADSTHFGPKLKCGMFSVHSLLSFLPLSERYVRGRYICSRGVLDFDSSGWRSLVFSGPQTNIETKNTGPPTPNSRVFPPLHTWLPCDLSDLSLVHSPTSSARGTEANEAYLLVRLHAPSSREAAAEEAPARHASSPTAEETRGGGKPVVHSPHLSSCPRNNTTRRARTK